LASNTSYHYRIYAYNAAGNSAYSNEISAVTLPDVPAAPTNLKAGTLTKNSVSLSWTDNASNESGYKLERKTGTGTYSQIATFNANTTSYTNTNLAPNTTYTYRVRAYNATGNSNYSNELSVKTPAGDLPAAPTKLELSAVATDRIAITWTDNSSNEAGFKIERKTGTGSFIQIATVGVNVTSLVNTGLKVNTQYTYRIRAYNTYGDSSYSNEISATTGNSPTAPSALKVIELTRSSIKISWTDNSSIETGFKIERKTGSGSFTEVGTVGANITTFTNTGLSANTTYTYRVRAYNASGNSAYSNEISAIPTDIPAAPTNLKVSATAGNVATLTWTDHASNETGFKIERKTGSGNYAEVATVNANTTSYTNSGLSANTTYHYRVRAYNAAGNSAYSNEASASIIRETVHVNLTIGSTVYTVNQQAKSMDVSPIILDGRTLLPFRYVSEAIGADVRWDATTKKVTVTLDNTVIELWIGNSTARVNGVDKRIDPANLSVKPMVLPPGRTMLPLRFIAENLGCDVEWNPQTKAVKITY
jgi:titin